MRHCCTFLQETSIAQNMNKNLAKYGQICSKTREINTHLPYFYLVKILALNAGVEVPKRIRTCDVPREIGVDAERAAGKTHILIFCTTVV